MEHILQFGISIDDEAIRRNIEASAIENLSKKLTQDIEGALGVGTNIYGGGKYCTSDSKLVDIVTDAINKVVEDNKDYILNRLLMKSLENWQDLKHLKKIFWPQLDRLLVTKRRNNYGIH